MSKWELRSQDRRVAQSVPNISLRKCKTKSNNYTAGDLKSDDYVNILIHQDEGFRLSRNLRGSLSYFENGKKDLLAMIHQLKMSKTM